MNALWRRLLARQPLEWTTGSVQGPTLRRALGWPALTAIGLGTMLGGIFPTVGPGAMHAGPAVVLSFVLTGAICVAVALCYAEFASMVPVAGSAYTYAYATLGEIVAWIIGWDLILEYGLSVAPTASSWSSYAQNLLRRSAFGYPFGRRPPGSLGGIFKSTCWRRSSRCSSPCWWPSEFGSRRAPTRPWSACRSSR
ncbi:MAG TPA: amino acid permease [Verrucomicrobiae bacterium]|nr:amino acid permease [Verrucomicrobiae bacterium]